MSQQIGRILADGIATGRSPRTLATDLAKGITGITKKRALVMARTEIIAAHAEGQLDAFEEMRIQDIAVMAEWSTAGDDRVCEECATLDAVVMTVEEARGLLPRHPNCRCAWIPANVGEKDTSNQFRSEAEKVQHIAESLKAELPERTRAGDVVPQTVEEVQKRSSWLGKEMIVEEPSVSLEEQKFMKSYKEVRTLADEAKVKGDLKKYTELKEVLEEEAKKVQQMVNLTEEEKKLVDSWGGWEDTMKIKRAYKTQASLAKEFDTLMKRLPSYNGVLYSGMENVPEGVWKTMTIEGKEFTLSVPFSASTRKGIAERYLGGWGKPGGESKLSLLVKTHAKNAVDLSWYSSKRMGSQFQDLSELLLRPNSRYIVESVGPIEHLFPADPDWLVCEIVIREI